MAHHIMLVKQYIYIIFRGPFHEKYRDFCESP
jgi:hypothetical protein